MKLDPERREAWRSVGLIAAVFFYFLIFAQFAFLRRLESVAASESILRPVMLAMGLGGIAGSVWAARRFRLLGCRCWLVLGFAACGMAAAMASVCDEPWVMGALAAAIGVGLGSLTVSIAPVLQATFPVYRNGWYSGWGVGLAYALSNAPWVYRAEPEVQSLIAAFVCGVGALLALSNENLCKRNVPEREEGQGLPRLAIAVGLFLILVWLDSAAFYSIQNSDALREISWGTSGQQWRNALAHLAAAVGAGLWVDRGGMGKALATALGGLLGGAWLLGHFWASAALATTLYVCGVSLYSVGLVAFGPLGRAGEAQSRAAWVFAIAGWLGSALGVGMARDLRGVPGWFYVAAPAGFAAVWLWGRMAERR